MRLGNPGRCLGREWERERERGCELSGTGMGTVTGTEMGIVKEIVSCAGILIGTGPGQELGLGAGIPGSNPICIDVD